MGNTYWFLGSITWPIPLKATGSDGTENTLPCLKGENKFLELIVSPLFACSDVVGYSWSQRVYPGSSKSIPN